MCKSEVINRSIVIVSKKGSESLRVPLMAYGKYLDEVVFFFKQKTAYEISACLVGSECV